MIISEVGFPKQTILLILILMTTTESHQMKEAND